MLKIAGREKDADNHLTKLFELLDAVDSRRHEEVLEWQKLSSPAQQVVSPIGYSCDCMVFQGDEKIEIDIPMAKVIRSRNSIRVGGEEDFRVKVVGFTHYNKRLRVFLHDKTSIISAQVRDSTFDYIPNIYTIAATNQGWLNVKAKARRLKDGQIKELYIFKAWPVADRKE